MATPVLLTKLFVSRPDRVRRHRLIDRLNEGPHRDLTLISAPAGFGKTTLVSECVLLTKRPIAWLSLDRSSTISTMASIDLSL
jgi:LuxR family maltose regulon positive regulatory protein